MSFTIAARTDALFTYRLLESLNGWRTHRNPPGTFPCLLYIAYRAQDFRNNVTTEQVMINQQVKLLVKFVECA